MWPSSAPAAPMTAYRAAKAAGASAILFDGGPHGTTCARAGWMPSRLLIAAGVANKTRPWRAAFSQWSTLPW
jgi:dihydrolipoamide dehydrogenase